jgi:hypothetical protein
MQIMRTTRTFALAVAALALGAVTAAPAQAVFEPLVPNLPDRPAILLETDYYVYGPGTGFDTPIVTVNVDNRGYDEPSTLYLYWQNRTSGQTMYYNLHDGLGGQERDLFGALPAAPARIFVPDLVDFRLFGPNSALGPLPAGLPGGTGLYQWVLEVRDADGDGVIGRGNAMYSYIAGVVDVTGDINGNANWTSNNAYFLRGAPTYVNPGATLNIQPGTVILGSQADQGTLAVLPDGTINASGDADRPIVFTSELPVGERSSGDWGGLVISGNAPVGGGQRVGEGNSGEYGGDDPADSSGVLRYVRVEFAGIRFNEQNELNGIALQGVGTGTVLEHLQIHNNEDDGIEFFGGTAQVKYVLITDAHDDSFDWTFGWQGKAQHVVAIQRNQENDHGIEADNDEDNFDAEPRSNPTIYNATFVGNRLIPGSTDTRGWLLRRGTFATIRNFIITNFDVEAIQVSSDQGLGALGTGVVIENGVINGNGALGVPQEVVTYLNGAPQIKFGDPRLPDPNSLIQPDVSPLGGSPARSGFAAPPADGFFDPNVIWMGGVNPQNPWIYEGWTTFSDN